MDSLGDRMKRFEAASKSTLTPRMPVAIRVDGRAFHTFTKGCMRPFDTGLIDSMVNAAFAVAEEIQGFKVGYVQSDEATFVFTDYDKITSQGWFGYELQKMISISASLMSVEFNYHFNRRYPDYPGRAVFDSRAFNIPENDVANLLLWRAKDWNRNSLQMYARSFFTHKEMHGKNSEDIHEMLHSIGKNWATDLNPIEKNGTFIIKGDDGIKLDCTVTPSYSDIDNTLYINGNPFGRV